MRFSSTTPFPNSLHIAITQIQRGPSTQQYYVRVVVAVYSSHGAGHVNCDVQSPAMKARRNEFLYLSPIRADGSIRNNESLLGMLRPEAMLFLRYRPDMSQPDFGDSLIYAARHRSKLCRCMLSIGVWKPPVGLHCCQTQWMRGEPCTCRMLAESVALHAARPLV